MLTGNRRLNSPTYRDPNTLYTAGQVVGSAQRVDCEADVITISGQVDPAFAKRRSLDSVAVLDDARRFVTICGISDGAWSAQVKRRSCGKDNAATTLSLVAFGKNSNIGYAVDVPSCVRDQITRQISLWLPDDSRDVPSLKATLDKVVLDAVAIPYVARSVREGIKTGNSYQTIALDTGRRTAGRQTRMNMLEQIDFRNKSVLDLGANTGEMSRSVRILGAALVDGFEYDPYFVQIGRATNAAVGATRVSLFQGDCTNPGLYQGMKYDVIAALNVWVYINEVVELFPKIAPVVVFETHTLDHGMEFYYSRMSPHYPHSVCLGLTDLGDDPHKSRAFIVFALTQDLIEKTTYRQFIQIRPYFQNTFIEKYAPVRGSQIWNFAADCHRKLQSEAEAPESNDFGRDGYFLRLLAGLHEFRNADNQVLDDNVFFRFLTHAVTSGRIDPNIKVVADNTAWMKRKLANKFEDMVNIVMGRPDRIPPIRLTQSDTGTLTFKTTDGQEIRCSVIDGHHRFFACQLAGIPKIHFEVTNKHPIEPFAAVSS